MANFYAKLRGLSKICENKPNVGLTKQTWSDTPFIIRGKDEGVPAWHYILVPFHQISQIKNQQIGGSLDCTRFGSVIKYRDQQGQIIPMSGWGIDPPKSLQLWFDQNYDYGTVDENTSLEYLNDDIRLCTIQRIIPDQLIGIYRRFNKQYQFHYVELFHQYETTLAYRAGIKNFDRLISINGVNIEEETVQEITERFKRELHLPLQILVCSPSTYHHYKSNNLIIHSHLPTVQHLKPVFDLSYGEISPSTISSLNQTFCVVQLETTNEICIVPQSSVFKSPDFTNINDICFIEFKENYVRGKIKFKGSKDECEHFDIDEYELDNESIISLSEINLSEISRFEDLPNELFYDLFTYLTVEELHNGFVDLNNRFNNLLFSRYNVSLLLNEKVDPLLIKLYGYTISHLIIDSSIKCDLNQFNNLESLIFCNRNAINEIEILPEKVPKLVNLSFLLKSDFKAPVKLINQIFSNHFLSLRNVNLGYIDKYLTKSWLKCPYLKTVSIGCDQSMIIRDILKSCPNLSHLEIHLLYNYDNPILCSSINTHPLKRFSLWSEELELSIDLIDIILSYMINVEHFYLQTKIVKPFIELIKNLINRLKNLKRFDCFIKELIKRDDTIDYLNNIKKISSSFNKIKCITQNEHFTIFATE